MNTIEMIKDWKENNYRSKYVRVDSKSNGPHTVYNNGVGVLFESFFVVTIGDDLQKSKTFNISKDNIDWKWKMIIEESSIEEAYRKTSNGARMISLESGKILDEKSTYSKEEILGIWIEQTK